MANESLSAAKAAKNDEFYTQYYDIEREINAYLEYDPDVFRGKTVLLPCDDPEWSNFTLYFAQNFQTLGLKKLISTSFAPDSKRFKTPYQPSLFEQDAPQFDPSKTCINGKIFELDHDIDGDGRIDFHDLEWHYLEGDGDFRSREVTALRDEADIIITNPPFSLFREFLAWIVQADKKFIIIGNINAITYKEIFPLIKNNQMWLGPAFNRGNAFFKVPKDNLRDYANGVYDAESGLVKFRNVGWYTNLDFQARHEELILYKKYYGNEEEYPKYDNYDAINVDKTADIPCDYFEKMGVPITYLDKHNPEQFMLEDIIKPRINGKWIYRRLIIKRR